MSRSHTLESQPRGLASAGGKVASRIHFDASAPDGAEVVARFVEPRIVTAWSELVELDASEVASEPEPSDRLDVLKLPSNAQVRSSESIWMRPPGTVDAPLAVSIVSDRSQISWRPGRLLVEGPPLNAAALAGVAEFAFYEGELRHLEAKVSIIEISAVADAPIAYRIKAENRGEWERFEETMKSLSLLRLTFARLEPRLLTPSRSLPLSARRLFRKLSRRAAIEDRLSALTDRLEVCEDLYEGAVDRITDHRWFRKEMVLETIIVVLLLLEVIQLGGDILMRWFSSTPHS